MDYVFNGMAHCPNVRLLLTGYTLAKSTGAQGSETEQGTTKKTGVLAPAGNSAPSA